MADISTKYSIGDVVYRAGTTTTTKQHPCPDCLGTRQWKATSPAGRDYQFGCPRCNSSYRSDDSLSLAYSEFVATTNRLTIGSVRYDSHEHFPTRERTSYMCVETGVGSGSVYDEVELFLTEEEANRAADAKAKLQNVSTEWVVKLYDRSLSLSDYQMGDAALKAAQDMRVRARTDIGMLFDDLRHAESIDQVQEVIGGFKFRETA